MVPGHVTYKVEIKKVKFVTEEGVKFPATALVNFQMDGKEKPWVELMGYMGIKEIYTAIDRGEALNLDYCYIEKFSLRDYRLSRNLDAREKVILKGFTARNALLGAIRPWIFPMPFLKGTSSAWRMRGSAGAA